MPSGTSKPLATHPGAARDTELAKNLFARAFRKLGLSRNMPRLRVRFRPYAALRSSIRYRETAKRIEVDLSDLLADAPEEALEALATILLCKLYRTRVPRAARTAYQRWQLDDATQERMIAIRRERSRVRVLPPEGRTYDLASLYDRLNKRFFDGSLRRPELGWTPHRTGRRLGYYDPAHDRIVISRNLDEPDTPAEALEYVLFHEMLHLKHSPQLVGNRRCVHTAEFLADERRFPGFPEIKGLLEPLAARSPDEG